MRQRRWLVQPFALLVCGGTLSIAHAQPDPNDLPKGKNPPTQPVGPPMILRGNVVIQNGAFGGGWPMAGMPMAANPFMPMQPGPMLEQSVRVQLGMAGFTDKTLQDALVEFLNTQEKARQPLREKARKLSEAIRNNAVTDAQMSALVNDFRAAIEDEKTRTTDALKALDGKISYSKKPRLEALLMMLGWIGDESTFLGSPGGNLGGMMMPPGMMGNQLNVWGMPGAPAGGNGAELFDFNGGVPGGANGNNFFYHVPNGRVRVIPPTANGGGKDGQVHVYVLPPDGNQVIPLPPNAAPLKLEPPAEGQVRDFVLTPPVVPEGDVIVPPPVAGNDLIMPPPLTPEPLVAPDGNGDIELAPPLPLTPVVPNDTPKEKGQK